MQRWYDWMLDQPHTQFILERETVLGLQRVRHSLGKSVSYEQAIKSIVEKARESFGAAFPIDTNSELAIQYLSSKNKYSFGRCRKAEKQPQEYAEYSCLYGVAVRVFLEPTDVKGEAFNPASRMALFAVYNVKVRAGAQKTIKHVDIRSAGLEASTLPSM